MIRKSQTMAKAQTTKKGNEAVKANPAPPSNQKTVGPGTWAAAAGLLAVLAWTYFGPLRMLVSRWYNEPDYLHGFFVPLFAGYLLYVRRDMLARISWRGSWWGIALLGAALASRWVCAYYYWALIDAATLIPAIAGVILFIGGWAALNWAWPATVFLVFMIPLPGFVAGILSHPLQRIGTEASTFLIQTLGIPSVSRGNVIVLSNAELGVVEACNGLRMMMLFFAVCVGAALLLKRNPVEKLIIVASAIPISVASNVLRITLTAILYQFFPGKVAETFFHDLAGWFMMPAAVVLLWIELWVLERMFESRTDAAAVSLAEARRAGG